MCFVQPAAQLLGPKDFSLDRMMAIFHSIVPEPVLPVAHLYTQVGVVRISVW